MYLKKEISNLGHLMICTYVGITQGVLNRFILARTQQNLQKTQGAEGLCTLPALGYRPKKPNYLVSILNELSMYF